MKLRVQTNVYSTKNAKAEGLTEVAQLDYSDGCYEFDLRIVWQDKEGRLWTERDSGCSCPTPFEDIRELDRCFLKDLREEYKKDPGSASVADWQTFIAAVETACKS